MREHWQPDIFERWEQGSKARALMAVQARAAWPTEEPPLLSLPASRHDLLTRLPRPLRVVCVALGAATGLAAAACGPTPKPSPEVRQPRSSPVLATKVETTPERILPLSGAVYFTQGAHSSDGSPTGVKSGIDLAPTRIVNCTLGTRAVVEEQIARATASGIITIVGNDRDTNDPNHSIVEIQEDGTGLRFGVMHLSKLLDHIQVGGRVSAGFLIGKSSCEVPKGGKTTGVHLHQYVKDKNGNYLPINGLTFSGWTIQGDIMTKGGEKRVADQRRCATDQACGGIRNDLGTGAVLGEAVKVAALPTVTPAKPAPPAPPAPTREAPKPAVKAQVPAMPWAQFSMGGLVEGKPAQGFKWIAADLWVKNLTSSWQKFRDSPTSRPSRQAKTIDSKDFDHDTEVDYTTGYYQDIPLFRDKPSGIPIPPKGAVRFHVLAQIPATRQPKMFVLQPRERDALFHQLTVPFAGGYAPKDLFERMTDFPEQSTETTFSCPRDRDISVKFKKLVKHEYPHAEFDLTIHNNGGSIIDLEDYLILREAWSSSGIFLVTPFHTTVFRIRGPNIPPDQEKVGSMGAQLAYEFGSKVQNKAPVITYPQLIRLTIYPYSNTQPNCTRSDMLFRIDGP